MNKKEIKIGFIGCGKMASAIISGILHSNFLPKEKIFASQPTQELAQKSANELGITVYTDNSEIAKNCDVIFVATKPNIVREVLNEVKSNLSKDKLVVSIAAGVKLHVIEEIVGQVPVIRVMPNAPLLLSEGMCGIAKGTCAKDEDVAFINELLSNMGKCLIVDDESQMDIITAISGSGPAFFYKTIHEMALAGEKLGLDYDKSMLLAAQTAIGSAKIMLTSDLSPQTLIANISTKGGCTEVGVSVMNNADTEKLFYEVIKATTDKAIALGK